MYAEHKGYSINANRISYGANGNPGKIEWDVTHHDYSPEYGDIRGTKTLKMVVYELKAAIDSGVLSSDYDDIFNNAFDRAIEDASMVDGDKNVDINWGFVLLAVIFLTFMWFLLW